MSISDGLTACFCGFLFGFVVGLVISGIAWQTEKMEFNKQAIERGYGEYYTDSDKVTTFKWKEKK